MDLVPLRFPRLPRLSLIDPLTGETRVVESYHPRYGSRGYETACGRFTIMNLGYGWTIGAPAGPWRRWTQGVGLERARFDLRREALAALRLALAADGLETAVAPA